MVISAAPKPSGVGGVKVGEGVYLRVGVAAEAGYDTNVFYNDENRVDSATLRVTPSAELTNADRDGASPPLVFSLGASLLYREYLKDNEFVRQQRAFNPTISGALGYTGGSGMTMAIADQFTRLEEPPYLEGQEPIVRDNNLASAQVGLAPGGGRIQLVFRYNNQLDLFETEELEYANRMLHELIVDGSWRWLPKTALFLQGSVGYTDYLSDATPGAAQPAKQNSIPYRVSGGIRGLITPKVTAAVALGYADAIYDEPAGGMAADPSGFSNLAVSVSLGYKPLVYTSLGLTYSHEFRDSPIIGDFYDLDAVGVSIGQQLGAFVLSAMARYEYRRYQGALVPTIPLSRRDHIVQTNVQADYFLQRWFFTGVGYANVVNRSSVEGGPGQGQAGLDYTKHLIVGRLGVTY